MVFLFTSLQNSPLKPQPVHRSGSTKHLLQTIDELNGMGIQFLSQRGAIDTEGALGRAILVIVSAMAELERCIIIERVRAGMRRARLEGRQIGRARLDVDRRKVIEDRALRRVADAGRQEARNFPRFGVQAC
jgi:DNA invertase Pin-like site-specific DNA recombinase